MQHLDCADLPFQTCKWVCSKSFFPSCSFPFESLLESVNSFLISTVSRVANNALPATFAIHRALKTELSVENRIGATFGKVYCGVVGGVRRHEFAVMGAPVNLAARLMASKVNKGILVDEAVGQQAGNRFHFKNLPPVQAKGYDKPVAILEPLAAVSNKFKKRSYPLTGRREEKLVITTVADKMLEDRKRAAESSMVFLMGESGSGKSALAASVVEDIRKMHCGDSSREHSIVLAARSTSNETQQRIPLRLVTHVHTCMICFVYACSSNLVLSL